MTDYKDLYLKLAAKVADVVELLVDVQKECEESYISDEDKLSINLVNTKKNDTETTQE